MLRRDTSRPSKRSLDRVRPNDRRANAPAAQPKGRELKARREAMELRAAPQQVADAPAPTTTVPPAWFQLLLLAAPVDDSGA
ncbi:hypothetical protein KFE25_000329 [Diacronema lutheri]|uniref:Uncharacterized protein n=1 Tax=Diacronema lutheri TaxID=2081491 RepID=A0A8J5XGY2_DIALT|nr:hypothetical protein KFE25_000329 [Diacronema lutheri]